jgi:hypothetical protein
MSVEVTKIQNFPKNLKKFKKAICQKSQKKAPKANKKAKICQKSQILKISKNFQNDNFRYWSTLLCFANNFSTQSGSNCQLFVST